MNFKAILRKIFSIRDNQIARDEWVRKELSQIEPGKKLLDAGCGKQIYKAHCAHLIYKSQDFGKYDGKGSGEGLQTADWQYGHLDYVGDIWNVQEQDNTFDVILCTDVFEHIPYPNETLREFSRLLKPGGTLLLTAPFASLPHMQPYYFYSGFSKDYYAYFLNEYGFESISITNNGNAFEFVAQELLRSNEFIDSNVIRFLYRMLAYGFLVPLLKSLSRRDTRSSKMLVFGYHVKANKRKN